MERTIIVDRYRDTADAATSNQYRGLQVHALPGLHDFLADCVSKHFAPGSRVLDLAAGSGALCRRLKDMGHLPTGIDYVAEKFRAEGIGCIQADLNGDFSRFFTEPFDGLVASEIIEHLENPRHFARECFKLLRPGCRMVVSTPNIDCPGSLAQFVTSGQFHWFSEHDYRAMGHINPLSQWQIGKCFSEAGFRFAWKGSYGKGASRINGSPRLAVLAAMLGRLSGLEAHCRGEIFVCVLEKPA